MAAPADGDRVDIVVAGPNRSELCERLLAILTHVGLAPRVAIVEQFVLDALLVGTADTERNRAGDIADDGPNPILDCREWRVESYRHVAAADVEADARDADLLLVGDDTTDRLCV